MKSLFTVGHSPTLRVSIFIVISLSLMVIDYRYHYLDWIRVQLSVVVLPLQHTVDSSVKVAQWLSTHLSTRQQLLAENARLRIENSRLRVTLQKFNELAYENQRLKALLDSSKTVEEDLLVAKVLAVANDPYSRKITLDKGTYHKVYKGQAVLDSHGVMGQIVSCGRFQSVAILITDETHALPVEVSRTGLRTVAQGMGRTNLLSLSHLPNNADIKKGDTLVTYEFEGSEFPSGYAVGEVIEVVPDIAQPYAKVQVLPSALLERNREVFLVWKKSASLTEESVEFINN